MESAHNVSPTSVRQYLPDAVKSAVWVHLNRIKPSLGGSTEVLRGHKVSFSVRAER